MHRNCTLLHRNFIALSPLRPRQSLQILRGIVATIFMPLTWITGFFGMNFGWLVLNITGWPAFLAFGLGGQALAVIVMLFVFKKQGWI